jgi:WD40 repeat protein/ABC-type sugar transport system substrate-binding protein
VTAAANPFPGLRPFREEEEYLFFGRERQVDSMIDRLAATHLLAVVGTSGSGKSSLVNCGLRPALHRGLMSAAGSAWRVAQFRPGGDPIRALARALAKPGVLFGDLAFEGLSLEQIVETTLRLSKLGLLDLYQQAQPERGVNLLVVADQFEELFRFREPAGRREAAERGAGEAATALVNLLLEAQGQSEWPIYVVLTMRSDFLGDCAQFPGLPEAVNFGQYLVPRLTRDERRAAIAGPVAVGGAELDPALLTRLINDVGDNPDQLSILQHALNRTWACWQEHGSDGPLRLAHYEEIGTMTRALDLHAEQTFGALAGERPRWICERVFKALTVLGSDRRGTRRPTRFGALCALVGAEGADETAKVEAVLAPFRHPACSFLMPPAAEPLTADTVVDISHESLMRVWNRLRGWAEQEAESARLYARVAETAELYGAGRAGLWGDPDLQIAAAWRRASRPNAAWAALYGGDFAAAIDFLDRSQQAWDARLAEERAQQQAETSRRLALEAQRALPDDHELALLLAVAAGRAAATDEAERAVREVIEHRGRSLRLLRHPDSVLAVAWSPDGSRLLTAGRDGVARIWDAEGGGLRAELHHDALVVDAAWSPDGLRLATAAYDKTARVWDAESGGELLRLSGHEAVLAQVAWSPDGRRLATAGYDNAVRVWNAEGGALERAFADPGFHPDRLGYGASHRGWVRAVAWSPAGAGRARIASASEDRTAKVWDADSGRLEQVLGGHRDRLRCVAWSPDGARLATASYDGTARVWDAAGGALLHDLRAHRDWVVDLRWSLDGRRLLTASRDGTARIWDADSGATADRPTAVRAGGVTRAAWSPDGTRIAAAGADSRVSVCDAASGEVLAVLTGHRGRLADVAWRPSGGLLATAGADGTVRTWDPAAGTLVTLRPQADAEGAHPAIWDAAWSPDGARIAGGDQRGRAHVWDATGGAPRATFHGHRGPVLRTAWAGGGAVVTVSRDHRAALWPPAGGAAAFLDGHASGVLSLAVHPADTLLATGGIDRRLCLWSAESAAPLAAVDAAHDGWIADLAWSADGRRLVTAGYDGRLRLWDVGDPRAPALAATLEGHSTAVLAAAWAPSGDRLASVGMDGTVRLWEAARGRALRSLHGHEGWTLCVAWRPDGAQLASAGRDGLVRLWSPDADRPRASLHGHAGPVRWLGYSPDGDRLLSAGDDGTARLWHTTRDDADNPEIAVVARHDGRIVRAAWSPGGDRILTAGDDGAVRVGLARLDDLVAVAERRAVRPPTRAEAELYGLAAPTAEAEGAPRASTTEGGESAPAARPRGDGPFRIAGIIFAKNEWASELRRGMEAAAIEAGAELTVAQHQFDLAEEVRLVGEAIAAGADAVVIAPRDLEASVPMLRLAHDRGLLVVCAGTGINHRDAAELVTSFYESNQFELGYRTGLYFAQWVFDRGLAAAPLAVGIVQCEQFEQCYQRGRGLRAAVAEAGLEWREVDVREGLLETIAVDETRQMLLEHPEIQVVWTQHDESTRGAVKAIRDLRRRGLAQEVTVFGVDWAEPIDEMLRAPDGVLQATTGQQARLMGRLALLDAVRALRGEDVGHYHKVLASPLYTRDDGGGAVAATEAATAGRRREQA